MLKEITKDTVFNSAQEVFEHVVAFLAKQGQRSEANGGTDHGVCKYRLNDLKCAGGCLFPDELYFKPMEGKQWRDLVACSNWEFPGFWEFIVSSNLINYTELIHKLQRNLHDSNIGETLITNMFSSKLNFIDSVEAFVKLVPDEIKSPDWNKIEFAENLK